MELKGLITLVSKDAFNLKREFSPEVDARDDFNKLFTISLRISSPLSVCIWGWVGLGGARSPLSKKPLNVPVGLDAKPRKASTSPRVSIPRMPVPFMDSGLDTWWR